jgi:hypothetical protein
MNGVFNAQDVAKIMHIIHSQSVKPKKELGEYLGYCTYSLRYIYVMQFERSSYNIHITRDIIYETINLPRKRSTSHTMLYKSRNILRKLDVGSKPFRRLFYSPIMNL